MCMYVYVNSCVSVYITYLNANIYLCVLYVYKQRNDHLRPPLLFNNNWIIHTKSDTYIHLIINYVNYIGITMNYSKFKFSYIFSN